MTHLLRGFYRGVYVPQYLRSKNATTFKRYQATINRFERSLGHRAQLRDLTPATYFAFKEWLAEQYDERARLSTLLLHRCLWNAAHKRGLAAECPFGEVIPSLAMPVGKDGGQ